VKTKDKLITGLSLVILLLVAAIWLMPAGLSRMPDVTLQGIEGNTPRLHDYLGRPVLVTFWATTCPGCIKEIPQLIKLHNELGPRGLTVIAVAMDYDPPSQVIALSKQKQLPYTIVLDIDGKVAKAFDNVRLTPTNFLIDPSGRIVKHKLGEFSEAEFQQLYNKINQMLDTIKGNNT
jgi:peroxiredoxin